MIAQELEVSLHMAFVEARQQRHEFITVEHLLLALLDNPSAAEVLRACSANIDDLRKSLSNFIKDNTPQVAGTEEVDTQPTLGFQRVIQRAIMHVQSTGNGKKEVTGANVLVAIFGEKDSHAVYYLHQQGVTRLDVVNYIAHGIKKTDPQEPAKSNEANAPEAEESSDKSEKTSPLEQFTQNLNQLAAKTTRCWSVKPVWAKPRLPRAWLGASRKKTCLKFWPNRMCIHSTWGRCWQARNTEAILSSVSKAC
jgi:ATP-dependent Clp protease ATP-binding subunit ClpA